jgi:hypothetical protein
VQSDPHFGNYRFRIGATADEDRIVLLDFGATRIFGRGFIENYSDIVEGALRRDRAQVLRGGTAIGLLHDKMSPPALDAFAAMCEAIVEPFETAEEARGDRRLHNAAGAYRWGDSDLPMRSGRIAATNALSTHFRVPPREIVFLHRRLAGVFIMLATLHCELDSRDLLIAALHDAHEAG